ncbi:MAG: hypothetical protein WKF84_30130 [Pyrinomonadaceae bacterium]
MDCRYEIERDYDYAYLLGPPTVRRWRTLVEEHDGCELEREQPGQRPHRRATPSYGAIRPLPYVGGQATPEYVTDDATRRERRTACAFPRSTGDDSESGNGWR